MKELMVLLMVAASFITVIGHPFGEGTIWGWGPSCYPNTLADREFLVVLDP